MEDVLLLLINVDHSTYVRITTTDVTITPVDLKNLIVHWPPNLVLNTDVITVPVLMKLNTVRLITDVLTHTLRNVPLTVNVPKMISNVRRYTKETTLSACSTKWQIKPTVKIDYQTTVLYSIHSDAVASTLPQTKLNTNVSNSSLIVKKQENVTLIKLSAQTNTVLIMSNNVLTKKNAKLTKSFVQITLVEIVGNNVKHWVDVLWMLHLNVLMDLVNQFHLVTLVNKMVVMLLLFVLLTNHIYALMGNVLVTKTSVEYNSHVHYPVHSYVKIRLVP